MNNIIYSNIVTEDKVREVQKETLEILANALDKSFGPMGSYTSYVKNMDKDGVNIAIETTKDGHTIIKNILFSGAIERSIQDQLVDLTRYVVKEVGDGTTSAVLLCNYIFKCLCENQAFKSAPSADIIKIFNNTIKDVQERIMNNARECTLEDIYDIALISTNNNEEISETIADMYKQYGMDVFIDVGTSTETNNIIKEYDGMTLETGFADVCFINNKTNNTCDLRNPRIYTFVDPIDTPEMLSLLDKIIYENIARAYEPRSVYEPIPTVIMCKALSPDSESRLESIIRLMNSKPGEIPLLIISDIHQDYIYHDIATMCGCKDIKKYIDTNIQKEDVEKGLAPTLDTITSFYGTADAVISDSYKTKIIRPKDMFEKDENGKEVFSEKYNMMLTYLENQIKKAELEDKGYNEIGRLKRRLNSFKGNMVDFLIGGIALSDRNNLKASVEDAVLNCRSAAKHGVGYGANFMALQALSEMIKDGKYINNPIVKVLYDAYSNLFKGLYTKSIASVEEDKIVDESLKAGCPLNIRNNEYDGKVLSSIRSDVVILETINKLLTIMYACNQYLVQTPIENTYMRGPIK